MRRQAPGSEVLDHLAQHRVVPVVVINEGDDARALGVALTEGGLPVAEITFRTSAAVTAIAAMADVPGLLVGAGTVLTAAQVDQAVEAGARFIVSPGTSTAVIRRCKEVGVLAIPGVATASEVMTALAEGLRVVKFFPAETSGGVAAIRALSGPFPQVRFLPSGGVTADNAAPYLDLPSVLAVGGSWMVPPAAIRSGDFAAIRAGTRRTMASVAGQGDATWT